MREGVGDRLTPKVWEPRAFCLSCGLCCRETEMVLTPSDIERLEQLGYRREEFAVYDGRFYRLRNVDGQCIFYRGGRCIVYDYRPIGCSMYPIIIDADTKGVVVDSFCPLASETRLEELRRAAKLVGRVLKELGFE